MLEEFHELFDGEAHIMGDRFDEFRMEGFAFMVGDCDTSLLRITKDLMAARLPDLDKPERLDDPDGLISGEAWQPPTHTASSRVVTLIASGEGRG